MGNQGLGTLQESFFLIGWLDSSLTLGLGKSTVLFAGRDAGVGGVGDGRRETLCSNWKIYPALNFNLHLIYKVRLTCWTRVHTDCVKNFYLVQCQGCCVFEMSFLCIFFGWELRKYVEKINMYNCTRSCRLNSLHSACLVKMTLVPPHIMCFVLCQEWFWGLLIL